MMPTQDSTLQNIHRERRSRNRAVGYGAFWIALCVICFCAGLSLRPRGEAGCAVSFRGDYSPLHGNVVVELGPELVATPVKLGSRTELWIERRTP